MQWFTRVKYRNSLRILYTTGGVFVTAKSWEKIPEDLRAKVSDICHRGMRELTAEVRKSNADALDVMSKNGVQVVDSTPADVAEFKAASDRAVAKLSGRQFAAEASEMVQKYLAEYRAANPSGGDAK